MANKYSIKELLKQNFNNCISTLKESSLDDRTSTANIYLCNNTTLEIFDFDNIKDNVYPDGYKSPDAIYIRNKDIFIIEFKNQNPCDIDSADLKEKFKTSVDFFSSTFNHLLRDYKFIFCLVYKNQSIHKENQRYRQGLQNQKCCSLSDINKNKYNSFYSDIITKDINFYKKNFSELKCG
jgi:hypothetical protein